MTMIELRTQIEQCDQKLQMCQQYETRLDQIVSRVIRQEHQYHRELQHLFKTYEHDLSTQHVQELLETFDRTVESLKRTIQKRYDTMHKVKEALESKKGKLLEVQSQEMLRGGE